MASNAELITQAHHVLLRPGIPAPIVLTRGEGCRVWDIEGRAYLDFSGGIAVVSVGHAHPTLARAIGEQAARLIHVSNLFYNDQAIALASEITQRTGYDRVFFCNSGTEANEALMKLCRRYHYERGEKQRTGFISAEGGFHGRTMGALSLTAQPKYHVGLAPLVGGVSYVPYNDLDAVRNRASRELAAIFIEVIQGEGGVNVASDDYLRGLRSICDEVGALLILDEIQTGCGRTGRFMASEWSGVRADACSLAKGIAGGFPLGAIAIREPLMQGFPPGSHGTTFGGNPLACAAGRAVLRIIDEEGLLENSAQMGERLGAKFADFAKRSDLPAAVSQRGRGLLQGLVLAAGVDVPKMIAEVRQAGLLVTVAGGNVLRVAPPLNVTHSELEEALTIIEQCLQHTEVKEVV